MVSNEETILKRGYLNRLGPRIESSDGWERWYFVLYGSSSKNEARLDWYISRQCSESSSGLRNGIFLEEISRVECLSPSAAGDDYDDDDAGEGASRGRQRQQPPPPPPQGKTLALYPIRQEKPILLRCDEDEDSTEEWLRQLQAALKTVRQTTKTRSQAQGQTTSIGSNEPIYTPKLLKTKTDDASTGCDAMAFDAEVEETMASSRQGLSGTYRLAISRQHLSLLDPKYSTTVLTWHYSHVRRFGYSDRSFSIEGGQRSGSGRGLFILKTHEGQRLFEEVQLRIRSLKSSTPSDNNSCAAVATALPAEGEEGGCTGGVKGQPPIPPRIHPPLNGANGHSGVTSSSNKSSPKTKKKEKTDEGQGQTNGGIDRLEKEEEEEEEGAEGGMAKDVEGQTRISEVLSRLRSLEGTGRYNDADQLYASIDPDSDMTYSRISLRGSGGGQATPPRPARTTENPYGEVLLALKKQERESLKMEEKKKQTKRKK